MFVVFSKVVWLGFKPMHLYRKLSHNSTVWCTLTIAQSWQVWGPSEFISTECTHTVERLDGLSYKNIII